MCVNNVNMHIPVYMQGHEHTFISKFMCYLCKQRVGIIELPVAVFFSSPISSTLYSACSVWNRYFSEI